MIKNILFNIYRIINRNNMSIDFNDNKIQRNKVNLEYCNCEENLGDLLSPVVCDYMLERRKINKAKEIKKTKHLFAIGSIIDFGYADGCVWGSGCLNESATTKLTKGYKRNRKLDIRAVRGPETRKLLLDSGYDCPEVYGDPAIIMPLIYNPDIEKEYDVSFIVHISKNKKRNLPEIGNVINIGTDDYKKVISQIKASKKIISSSLHGIILAETYGVPAVFVAKDIRTQMMKFYDWYEATGREDFVIASSYEEALELESPALPKLEKIRENLMASFPYDLWT